jgi:hypothetical protein
MEVHKMEAGDSVHSFDYVFDISKSSINDELYIYGIASTESEDRDGETVSMASLEKAFAKYMHRSPVLMYNHNGRADAVGKVVEEFVGEDGTVYKSGIINNELHIVGLISKAGSSSLSIGGKARKIQKSGKRCLLVSDLHEISIVPIASNGDALFHVVKSACVGDSCPINTEKNSQESDIMEKEEIVTLVKGVVEELKTADDFVVLQKKYDALLASSTEPEVVDAPEVDVVKALTDKVDALTAELEGMKTTPIQKGIEDGDVIVEKAATDITSVIMARHYGGA